MNDPRVGDELTALRRQVADLQSRLACVVEASYWDRPYNTRIEAIRGMCDLTTNGLPPLRTVLDRHPEQTVAPCPSCDRDLSHPGKPGHECYTYAEHAERIRKTAADRESLTLLILGRTATHAADAILAAGWRKP